MEFIELTFFRRLRSLDRHWRFKRAPRVLSASKIMAKHTKARLVSKLGAYNADRRVVLCLDRAFFNGATITWKSEVFT
jgi:hypothetical protein